LKNQIAIVGTDWLIMAGFVRERVEHIATVGATG
jgi:hypothetical protein